MCGYHHLSDSINRWPAIFDRVFLPHDLWIVQDTSLAGRTKSVCDCGIWPMSRVNLRFVRLDFVFSWLRSHRSKSQRSIYYVFSSSILRMWPGKKVFFHRKNEHILFFPNYFVFTRKEKERINVSLLHRPKQKKNNQNYYVLIQLNKLQKVCVFFNWHEFRRMCRH